MGGVDSVNLDPFSIPLSKINVANPYLFQSDKHWDWFKRLRDEDPIHYCAESEFGPYWSITRYHDIMEVDTNHNVFSSEPAIVISDPQEDFALPMFIAMDQPKHDEQRKIVSPAVDAKNLRHFEPIIRQRTCEVLDNLPSRGSFDWVETVSIELTTRMLATLFDFPFEDRSKLTRWSDVATAAPGLGLIETEEERQTELLECLKYFTQLWDERSRKAPANDFISMLVHGAATQNMAPMEYLGNLILLIVGGNDTTRSTMTASILTLHQNPSELEKLKSDRNLIPSMVSETIRWQTPLAHMRRLAITDTVLNGKHIKAGDKVVMWYVSGNRDERFFDTPDMYCIDRKNVRKHLSFGFGIHRCMGNRLAEMQLQVLWEEILRRFDRIEVIGEPLRTPSTFVKGYTNLEVKLHEKR